MTENGIRWLKRNYAEMTNRELAMALGISVKGIEYWADKLELRKSKEHLTSVHRTNALIQHKNRKNRSAEE